jgi:7,8-dihydropterin-6-yl-methyl-4-(beta-D-ribofuranosyl)aminobenzene 5'-phosphate synthase
MDVKIVNVYNNEALPTKGLKSGHGESFHITIGDKQVLFDVGWKGKRLMHNVKTLGIDVDGIDTLVFSHGHRDHTGGLKSFLKARTTGTQIPIYAHPNALEPKQGRKWIFHIPMGLPKLNKELAEKAQFKLAKTPVEVLPKLFTTGEIPIEERLEKPGIVKVAFHEVGGQWKWDPVIDDLSLILQTRDGLVLITGCCHAGLLNTCAKATQLFNNKIKAILGGTHMLEYSEEDIEHVGEVLEKVYGTPELYLNHCTGKKAIERLRSRFGSEIVRDCHVGTEIVFKT